LLSVVKITPPLAAKNFHTANFSARAAWQKKTTRAMKGIIRFKVEATCISFSRAGSVAFRGVRSPILGYFLRRGQ